MQLQGKELIDKVKELATSCIISHGFELVEINYYYVGNRLIIRIFIDKPCGGINIDECALMNEELGKILDVSGIIEQSYILEISSPGIDRILKSKDDFKRVINRKLIFFLSEAIEGKNEICGILNRLDDDSVYIESEEGEVPVSYNKIIKARQIIA